MRSHDSKIILVATSSNPAANNVLQKLVSKAPNDVGKIGRLTSRNVVNSGEIPQNLLYACFTYNEDDDDADALKLRKAKFRDVGQFKVIIGTLQSFHKMMEEYKQFQRAETFSHLIVDEAGQATEPDTTIPMTLLPPQKGKLILAGDRRRRGSNSSNERAIELRCGVGENIIHFFFSSSGNWTDAIQ